MEEKETESGGRKSDTVQDEVDWEECEPDEVDETKERLNKCIVMRKMRMVEWSDGITTELEAGSSRTLELISSTRTITILYILQTVNTGPTV